MLTDEVLKLMDADLKKLEQVFQGMIDEVYEVSEKSKILCSKNPRIAKKSAKHNSLSNHFAMNQHTPGQIRTDYNAKLMHNLDLGYGFYIRYSLQLTELSLALSDRRVVVHQVEAISEVG
ncbi:hypothetical protein ACA910_019841 [Epithemia clementina (nom. ined.)]